MPNLKRQAVHGVYWTSLRSLLTAILAAMLLVVKARYLSPVEFGVLAIIDIVLKLVITIENFGLSTAIIQKDKITTNELSSLFFFQLGLSGFLGILILLLSPIIANVFNMEILYTLLPIFCIIILLNGPTSLFVANLEKEFYFKELSLIIIIKEIALFSVTSFLLYLGKGLFSIVLGQLFSTLIMSILTVTLAYKHKLLNLKFYFKFEDIKYFINFGMLILGKRLMTQLTNSIDELIIGYFLSNEILGLYHFAKNLLHQVRSLGTTAISKVMLPLLAKVKKDISRLTTVYNNISKYIGVFAFPMFIGLSLTANLFIPLFFGEEWLDGVTFFFILSIANIPYLLTSSVAPNLLYVVNKAKLSVAIEFITNISYIILLFFASWAISDIYIIVSVYAIYIISQMTFLQFFVQEQLNTTFKEYLSMFKYIIIATLIMSFFVISTQLVLSSFTNLSLKLVFTILIGAFVYIISLFLLDKKTIIEIKTLIIPE